MSIIHLLTTLIMQNSIWKFSLIFSGEFYNRLNGFCCKSLNVFPHKHDLKTMEVWIFWRLVEFSSDAVEVVLVMYSVPTTSEIFLEMCVRLLSWLQKAHNLDLSEYLICIVGNSTIIKHKSSIQYNYTAQWTFPLSTRSKFYCLV